MDDNALLITGSIISILLAINGFFIRELVKSLYEVKIRVEVLISKHDNTEKIAEKNAADIINIRERLHKTEGEILQIRKCIEDYKDD
jgi:hypothetical protein